MKSKEEEEPLVLLTTYTGRQVNPLTMTAKDFHILDIAHALSNQCRYNGHVRYFYSVAQHCVLLAESEFPGLPKWKLMHDAAEAYLPDVCVGFKSHLPKLVEAENRILKQLAELLELPPLKGKILEDIKEGDRAIRFWEGRAFMPEVAGVCWGKDVEPPKVKVKIERWPPHYAEERFIKCFRRLFNFTKKEKSR